MPGRRQQRCLPRECPEPRAEPARAGLRVRAGLLCERRRVRSVPSREFLPWRGRHHSLPRELQRAGGERRPIRLQLQRRVCWLSSECLRIMSAGIYVPWRRPCLFHSGQRRTGVLVAVRGQAGVWPCKPPCLPLSSQADLYDSRSVLRLSLSLLPILMSCSPSASSGCLSSPLFIALHPLLDDLLPS